ncbi:GerAB/ArcD/ProY family transporter [Paenibacillus sp. y28]|uniref:GerAB/ArcD/ProY family transporter n=1 Tax=Paenibacillus sp. y28 TaxID=3129110 RepID=UPI003019D815
MNKPQEVTSGQMAAMLIGMTTGSAIVFIPNPVIDAAKKGAWISMLLSYMVGLLLLAGIVYLNRAHHGSSLIQLSKRLIGKALTLLLAIPVIGMLLFAIPAICAGIGDFFTSVMMKETPAYIFVSTSLITAALTVRAGIQVMARMFVLLALVLVFSSAMVMVLAIPLYEPGFLMPVWPTDLKPILHGTYIASGFPFGEVVLFSMLLPYLEKNDPAAINKIFGAFTLNGLLLTLSTVCTVLVFGPLAGSIKYSLYRLAGEIEIADIIQRIESVIGIALIIGSYMKASLFLFILNQTVIQLTGLRNDRILIYPMTLLCIVLALTMFGNPGAFYHQVYVIWPFTVLTVSCTLLLVLVGITLAKRNPALSEGRKRS